MKREVVLAVVTLLVMMSLGIAPAQALPPGGRSLYVSNSAIEQTPPGQGANVASFTFDAAGLLSPMSTVPACGGARGLVITPDLRFVYLACVADNQIRIYGIAADGALTSIGQVSFPQPFGIAIAPNGGTLYISSASDNTLAAFRVGSDGLLTALNRVDSGGSAPARALAVTPDGRFVYVVHGAPMDTVENVVTGFALNKDDSLGSNVAEANNGIGGAESGITPDGRFLYVASEGSDSVFGYQIGADGSLTAVPGGSFPAGDGAVGLAISPDGRLIYAAASVPGFLPGQVTGEVDGWRISADGALTEVERLRPTGRRPAGIDFAPDGQHLYIGDLANDELIAYNVSGKGKLKEIQVVSSAGLEPAFQSVAILPNLGPVASFSVQAGAAGSPSRFDGSASSDPDGTVARYLWDFGDGTSKQTTKPSVQHVYKAPGTYEVRLTIIDDEGCSDRLIFTGQLASCVGSDSATATQLVIVN